MLTGVVLAGGESRRFGSDKLLARVRGAPMVSHVVSALRELTDRVVVSVRDPRSRGSLENVLGPGLEWIGDRPGSGSDGPGAGMLAALELVDRGELLFVPGDMPWLEAPALRELLRRARGSGAACAAPLASDGWTVPLVQYQRRAPRKPRLALLSRRVTGPSLRPTDLVRGGRSAVLIPTELLSGEPRAFRNVNVPGELRWRGSVPTTGSPRRTVRRAPEAARAFWAAVTAESHQDGDSAARLYESESRFYGRAGLGHLKLHALEDALRCSRAGRLPTQELEHRLTRARARLG